MTRWRVVLFREGTRFVEADDVKVTESGALLLQQHKDPANDRTWVLLVAPSLWRTVEPAPRVGQLRDGMPDPAPAADVPDRSAQD